MRRCGNPKFVVAVFTKELENFQQLHFNEPQIFIRLAAFLRKLVHNFELNKYKSLMNSSNITRIARSKLPPAVVFN